MPCTVQLTYDLAAEGEVSNIELASDPNGCAKHFFRSVEKSLIKTEFSPGIEETGCIYERTFSFE